LCAPCARNFWKIAKDLGTGQARNYKNKKLCFAFPPALFLSKIGHFIPTLAPGVWERLQAIRQQYDPQVLFYGHIGQT